MRELLSAEFYKLYKSLGFRVCLIVFFVQDIIYLISVGLVGDILGIELTGDFQVQYLLGSFSAVWIYCGVAHHQRLQVQGYPVCDSPGTQQGTYNVFEDHSIYSGDMDTLS